jgi:RimJ/RimL family protein N-acetyltransferase
MKISIRKIRLSDAKDSARCLTNKEVIAQITGTPYPCPVSFARKTIQRSLKNWKIGKAYHFAILADGKFVGEILLENPDTTKKIYEVGYYVGRDSWGKGIATKAIMQIVKFGFEKLKLMRIWAGTFSENPASGRALEKAGFKLEGTLRKSDFWKGNYVDSLIWGKLR